MYNILRLDFTALAIKWFNFFSKKVPPANGFIAHINETYKHMLRKYEDTIYLQALFYKLAS